MTIAQQNVTPDEPTLQDVLALFKKELLIGLNCHHTATIQSFNPVTQTATATINYKKTYYLPDPVSGVYGPQLVDYPLLLDAPVVCLGGATGALTFPIAEGDECLVLFNDRDIDTWTTGVATAPVATARLHSFSDGIILVGLRSQPNAIKLYDPAKTNLRSGAASRLALTDSDAALEYGPASSPTSRIAVNSAQGSITYGAVSLTVTTAGVTVAGGSLGLTSGSGGTSSLTAGTAVVKVDSATSKVTITNGTTLGALLAQLTTQLQSLTTTLSTLSVTGVTSGTAVAPITPTVGVAIAAVGTSISTIATSLGNLLV